MDKNQAVLDYLKTCPEIYASPLYFNFVNAKDSYNQVITTADDISLNRSYIDGSILRRYTFNIVTFKSVTDTAVVKLGNYPNENVEDLDDVQALIDWIAAQEEQHNYPDFGENCIVENISTTTDTPRLDGINSDVTPPLAMYSISIVITYIDKSKVIWQA